MKTGYQLSNDIKMTSQLPWCYDDCRKFETFYHLIFTRTLRALALLTSPSGSDVR